MRGGRSLGREFRWLWSSYAASTLGTWLAFGAFPLIAIKVLDAGPAEVALLAAVGPAVGAAVAVPLGPWVEFRRKRPVMIGADAVRCAAMLSVPFAYALGLLGFVQLVTVSVVVAAADITFTAAGAAFLKALLPPEDLLAANARFEGATWTASVLGPPLGGAASGTLGPMTTVATDALTYVLSAAGIGRVRESKARPPRPAQPPRRKGKHAAARKSRTSRRSRTSRTGELLVGWRHILTDPVLRPLFLNVVLVNGLIMASAPLLAVLMLDDFGFAPWQYGLAFAVPCLGGLVGSQLAPGLVARHGRRTVLLTAGTLRACWPIGLAFIHPGATGLLLVMTVEFGLIASAGVFNPVLATQRLVRTPQDQVTRVLTAWSVTTKASIATMTALWGVLAAATHSPRTAIAIAGLLLLATPFLLPWRAQDLKEEKDAKKATEEPPTPPWRLAGSVANAQVAGQHAPVPLPSGDAARG
ncbi:MFS transporter [Yinghuangia sp. YIM S09857]|uniref:MFS transporter n=1 Tax=Yinghuangia sp. YIM S09857 TaxID=3436929 RepID=UPI003F533167